MQCSGLPFSVPSTSNFEGKRRGEGTAAKAAAAEVWFYVCGFVLNARYRVEIETLNRLQIFLIVYSPSARSVLARAIVS